MRRGSRLYEKAADHLSGSAASGAGGIQIRVLHLRDSERLCGPGKIIRDCIRASPDAEIRIRVAAFESSTRNAFLDGLLPLVPVTPLPASRLRLGGAVRTLVRVIRSEGIDILHVHDFKANAVGLVAARWTGIPIVSTVHGRIPITAKARLYGALDKVLLHRMDLVFAVSAMMARQLAAEGISHQRLVLARNGIMLDEHPFGYRSNRLRSEGVLQDGDVAIGHVGRISREKGVVQLVEAFKRVVAEFPSSRLIIAGDGPDIERVRRAAAALGPPARVVFLGYREDIEAVYGALDLFVLNSTTEGLPNAILEAMAFGVPVVATAVGGTPELVRNRETGLLIPPSDPAALAAAIGSVLREKDAATERVRRARELIEREFDMVRLSHFVNEAYRRVVTTGRKA